MCTQIRAGLAGGTISTSKTQISFLRVDCLKNFYNIVLTELSRINLHYPRLGNIYPWLFNSASLITPGPINEFRSRISSFVKGIGYKESYQLLHSR